MQRAKPHLSALGNDRQILGNSLRHAVVCAQVDETRDWLRTASVCTLLRQHHISHVGIMHAEPPYEVVRNEQSGTFMMSCFEGEGVVLADGAWQPLRAGECCLLPPFVRNAFRCTTGKAWKFAWVRYEESRESAPIVSSLSPVIGQHPPLPLKLAIEGLHAELQPSGPPVSSAALHHWTELIHHHVLRYAQPTQIDERLWRLWQKVEPQLAHPWTLRELATIACLSEEHLRRLCQKQQGRSPIQHLTFLRLRHARHLLATTRNKIETIASAVGFSTPFALSNALKKWTGMRPSEFREG